MSKKKILVIAAVLVAGGAAIAVSAPGHRLHGGMMDRWMHGSDRSEMGPGLGLGMGGGWRGTLTREQFDEKVRERFARLDANSDGVIDVAEIEAALAKGGKHHRGHHGRRAGRDAGEDRGEARGARSISKSEFLDEVRRRFAQADLDGDGKITDADLPPVMRGRGILSGEHGLQMRGPRGGHMLSFLRGADADKDGAITLDEAVKAAEARFDRRDRTKDGVLDRADRDALRKEMTDYRVKRILHRYGATAEGKITREQAFKVAGETFERMDRNKDGSISRGDRRGWHGRGHDHERRMWRGRDQDRGGETAPNVPGGEQKKI